MLTLSTSDPLLLLSAAARRSLCTRVHGGVCLTPTSTAAAHCISSMGPRPRAAMRWGDQGLLRNEARTPQADPIQYRTQAPMHLTGRAQHRCGCTQELAPLIRASPKVSPVLPSQPAWGLATFALLSPASNSATATGSFPSPTPRDPSLAEHLQHLFPQAMHPACEQPMSQPRASPALAQLQLQSRSYLVLIKNIPHWKEPKGRFLPAAPGWRGFEGCHPHPAKHAAHCCLRPWPGCSRAAPWGLFLVPVKKERQSTGGRQRAGRCPAGPCNGNGQWLWRVPWPPSTCPAGPRPLVGGGQAPGPCPSPGGEQ
ncbi:uncharacterized protein LOC114011294 [Falco peregrinus]|uniref:uncharacterized protein LOC114011294 n=1 Tax=Falco peregrinus TaxID=8954 RepID=UPI0024786076|nr:uncharacterized protein LOC114011294 [Falco peregrinus]